MSHTVLVLSGPNLNLLGDREPEIYGTASLEDHVATATERAVAAGLAVEHLQSNAEAELVEAVHRARRQEMAAIIVNPGALTHYSWSLHDALASFAGPVVELHLSNPAARESFRHQSVVAPVAAGTIAGFGGHGYTLAVDAVVELLRVIGDLDPISVRQRWGRVRQAMTDAEIDALVVQAPANIRYLTGFTGSAGELVVTPDHSVLLTDGRYGLQAPTQLESVGAPCEVDPDAHGGDDRLRSLLDGCGGIGLEADTITWSAHRGLARSLGEDRLVATTGLVEGLRAVKDDAEVQRMQLAAELATAALGSVVALGLAGHCERDVGLALDDHMRRAGAEGPAYETIVASGPNAALPHARPSARRIEAGDLVIIDVGALVDGYRSDMTRTFSVGPPSGDAARMLEVVTHAQSNAAAVVQAGVQIAEIDRVARAVIDEAGWSELFSHGTGHGVGLDIHEAPSVTGRATATLQPGHCITVEPGVYRAGFGGVRFEDLLVVTESGARTLTAAPKDPVVA